MASRLQDVILRGTAAARPAATDVAPGTLYYSTDTVTTDRSNGTTWETFADAGSSGINQLTGDVTAGPGSGSQAATIANDAVTFAKFQNINTARLLGRGTAAVGNVEEVSLSKLTIGPGPTLEPDSNTLIRTIGITIGDGSGVISTGAKEAIQILFSCTISEWTILSIDSAVTSGSIVIDIWKDTYANYPPTVADTITAAAKPTVTTAIKANSSTLTGWTTTITAGDILKFNVDSVTSLTKVILLLKVAV